MLLIAECLPGEELAVLHVAAGAYGLHTLIELYEPENMPRVAALAAAAPDRTCVGVNNRDLRSFTVDLGHSLASWRTARPGRPLFRKAASGRVRRSTDWPLPASGRC